MTERFPHTASDKGDFQTRPNSAEPATQSLVALELRRLRTAVLLSALLILGGLCAVVVALASMDWYYPAIAYIVTSYIVWVRLA